MCFIYLTETIQTLEYLPFQLKGKNFVDKINGFEKNSFLTVEAVPSGRMWIDPKGNEKFFPSFNAIFISSENEMLAPQGFPMTEEPVNEAKNDLPF